MSKHHPLQKHLPNVSRVALGCMGFGGQWEANTVTTADEVKMQRGLEAALEANINFFDHADIYSRGKAEDVFGRILGQQPELREKLYLQSKCGIRFGNGDTVTRYDFSKAWITESIDNSLKRLQTDYLDCFLLHRPDPLMETEDVAEAFSAAFQAGKVRHFGVSNMNHHQIAFLQNQIDQPLIINQIDISLNQLGWLDQGILTGNPEGKHLNFPEGTMEYCQLNGIQIQSWGSLCQGLFSGKNTSDSPDHVKATALLVEQLANEYNVSATAIVTAWLLRHPAGIQPIIGTTNSERIQQAMDATSITLSREHWYKLYVTSRGAIVP